jgi:hypothetical protein
MSIKKLCLLFSVILINTNAVAGSFDVLNSSLTRTLNNKSNLSPTSSSAIFYSGKDLAQSTVGILPVKLLSMG